MNGTLGLLFEDPNEPQRGASDPRASVWVAASAGTGKTKVLTDRVLRLMLEGSEPKRILCLTYTKAAAAEMANRIADRLGDWATADGAALEAKLLDLLGRKPSDTQRRRARQLFARVLDSPGGLNIQTIHAFCQSLLARFPLEAGVAPHSAVMDDRDAEDLLAVARHQMIEAADHRADLADALAITTSHLREGRFAALMREVAQSPVRILSMIERHGSAQATTAAMRRMLGLSPDERPASIVADACGQGRFDLSGLRYAAAALASGSEADCRRAAIITNWLDADPATKAQSFERYASVFLTSEGRVREDKTLGTRKVECARPGTTAVLRAEAERLACVLPRRRAAVTAEASEALLVLGQALMQRYNELKMHRARLDYSDLVETAVRLLRGEDAASWVLYKLDGGIDHVLIDEAQDTAPEQWEVIRRLTEEFFSGEGARNVRRTIFAVGDVKQSIFSFQGADPAAFIASRDWYGERIPSAGHDWRPIPLNTSFRSTRAVLAAVDATFANPEMARSIALEPEQIVHQAYRLRDGGRVEVWRPIAERPPEQQPDPWAAPAERVVPDAPQIRLARLIAERIQAMIVDSELLESKGRPIAPGDVMVLVRRRTRFMQALVRALKERQLPVAGIDRMLLTEQLAVMDLMAIGNFVLLPQNDLTLATVLKGPVVGLDEDTLFAVAHGRRGTLWEALRARAEADARCASAYSQLTGLLALADRVTPFEFFMSVLGPTSEGNLADNGRRRLLSRLGREADDQITEFLEMALAYERLHPPSLQGFLYWLERSDVEIKRDPEQGQHNAVRVMTVHGAKGLQAPIVFLPDTCQKPDLKENLLWPCDDDGRHVLLWPPSKSFREAVAEDERRRIADKQIEEYRRLLYVAMTRASDRLIVCGWLTRKSPPEDCWYHAIETALRPIATETEDPVLARFSGACSLIDSPRTLRLVCRQERGIEPEPFAEDEKIEALPAWATRLPRAGPAPTRPLRPSHEQQPTVLAPVTEKSRFHRGRLIHRLLQELPDLAPAARAEAARRWLNRPMHRLSETEQAAIVAEVLGVIENPEFAPLFAAGSRTEVPLSGEVNGQLVAGQIDRLRVTHDEVTILDYKSDRPAPLAADRVPPVYLRQMAAYRALLRGIYPGKSVRCVLLWTEEPRPMPLDDTLLDRWAP